MAIILADTYEALIEAGASKEKAKKASQEIAGMDKRLIRLEVMSGILIAGVGYIIILLHSQ